MLTDLSDDHALSASLKKMDGRLCLIINNSKMAPLSVDFVAGRMGYRLRHGGGKRQPLARAVGMGKGAHPTILDATAGFGKDAFILASLGCQVDMLERAPMIAALLEDGLQRAAAIEELSWINDRLSLCCLNATTYLAQQNKSATNHDVVYLDPMYPHAGKTALPAKEMQILRKLVGSDDDAPSVLALACQYARKRVVVKRPRTAAPLPGPPPSNHIEAPNTRYDIYLVT